jgi:hypothetical protein
MTDRELMQQALDALEKHAMQRTYAGGVYIANVAIALRERLAQPDTDKNQLEWQKQQTEHWKQHCFDMMKKLQEKNGV